jgi:hypothetical protein
MVIVSAFLKIYEDAKNPKSVNDRFLQFLYLVETGIPIHLFISKEYVHLLNSLNKEQKKIITLHEIELEDTSTFQIYKKCENASLPINRNVDKDTEKYIILMNTKIEFLQKIIEKYHHSHYLWVDFNIFHVIKDKKLAIEKLKSININFNGIMIPGCWTKGYRIDNIINTINWRFCGGILFGDRDSLIKLYELHYQEFPNFLQKYKTLTWEVNMWAYYEYYCNNCINFIWFQADHDDSIIPS